MLGDTADDSDAMPTPTAVPGEGRPPSRDGDGVRAKGVVTSSSRSAPTPSSGSMVDTATPPTSPEASTDSTQQQTATTTAHKKKRSLLGSMTSGMANVTKGVANGVIVAGKGVTAAGKGVTAAGKGVGSALRITKSPDVDAPTLTPPPDPHSVEETEPLSQYAKIDVTKTTLENSPSELVAQATTLWQHGRAHFDDLQAAREAACGRASQEAAQADLASARQRHRAELGDTKQSARDRLDAAKAQTGTAEEISELKRELIIARLRAQLFRMYWKGAGASQRGRTESNSKTPQPKFPCPECHVGFETLDAVNAHFDGTHSGMKRVTRTASLAKGSVVESAGDIVSKMLRKTVSIATAGQINLDRRASGAGSDGGSAVVPYEVVEWADQTVGTTRSLVDGFRATRSEMRSTCNGGLPRFIGTLQLLIYNKPPNMAIRAFEQQCVPWVDKNVVPGCKVCKAALKGRLSGMLRGSMQSTRHHCRICGGITCDNCTERLLVDGPDGVVGIVQTFQVRAKLARLGKGAVEGDGGVKSADEQLAIIANDPESPTREPPILTCTQCYALIAEFHGMEKTWVSFVDKWLCDQVFPLPIVHVQKTLSRKLERYSDIAAELSELVSRFYKGEALEQYDHAVELEKEYKAALQDVNTTRDAIGKLKPRKGSADLTLIKRVHSSVRLAIDEVKATVPKLPSREDVTQMHWERTNVITSTWALGQDRAEFGQAGALEVWENQRWVPGGFKPTTSAGRLMNDAQPWETKAAKSRGVFKQERGFKSVTAVVPFPGDRYIADSKWTVCPSTTADEDGWEYASSFGPLVTWSLEYNRLKHHVRRRLWMRPVEMAGEYAGATADAQKAGSAVWTHDADVDVCTCCRTTKFTLVKRRHHCRFCGNIVCDGCSHGRKYSDRANTLERCCDKCIEVDAVIPFPADRDEDSTSDDVAEVIACDVYENQRYAAGWHKTILPDRQPFTMPDSSRGFKFIEAIKPPPGYEWHSREWFVKTGANVDVDGWQFAGTDWDRTLIKFSSKYSRMLHFTRRRVMTRKCRKLEAVHWPRAIAGELFALVPKHVDGLAITCSSKLGGALVLSKETLEVSQRFRCCDLDPSDGYSLFEAEHQPGSYLTVYPGGKGVPSVVQLCADMTAATRFKAGDHNGVWFRLRTKTAGHKALTGQKAGAKISMSDGTDAASLWRMEF
eukprot:m.419471 g.419471  ORF g.419471 m.419471 type:complete len:1185 (+) comp31568_c0_seq1:83-3637(+)